MADIVEEVGETLEALNLTDDFKMSPPSSMVYGIFPAMNLKGDLLKSLHKYGYKMPSNALQRGIVPLCNGRDVILQPKTEPGKIATYCAGILQQIDCSVFKCQNIILAPGNVAVDEIATIMRALGDSLGVEVFVCGEENDILSAGVHVVVGTRDLVLKLLKEKKLSSDEFRMLVLDEADLMLESDYIMKQVYDILECLREQTRNKIQVSAFSETMPTEIIQKTSNLMTNPFIILAKDLGDEEELTLKGIKKHQFVEVKNAKEKHDVLLQLLKPQLLPAIILVHNPQELASLTKKMKKNSYNFSATRKDMDQAARDKIGRGLSKSGVLISTSRWVRGIEFVEQVRTVFITETCYGGEYLRCVGWFRGVDTAISFATRDDWEWLIDLQEMYKVVFEKFTPKLIEKPTPSKFPVPWVFSRLTPRVFSRLTPSKLTQESPKTWALEVKPTKRVLYNSEDDEKPTPSKFPVRWVFSRLIPKVLSSLTPSKFTQESPKKWRALEVKPIKRVLYNSEDDEKPTPSKFLIPWVFSRLTRRVFSRLTPSKLTQESPKKWRALEEKLIEHVLYNSEDDDGKFSALMELLPRVLGAAQRCIIIVNEASKDRLIKSMECLRKYRIVTTIEALIKIVASQRSTRPYTFITTEKVQDLAMKHIINEKVHYDHATVVISYDLCLTWEQYDRRASWCAEEGVIINLAAKEDWSMVFDIQSRYDVTFTWLSRDILDHLARLTEDERGTDMFIDFGSLLYP